MSELMPDMNAGQPAEPVQEETPSEWTGPSQEEWQDYLDFREQVNQAQQAAPQYQQPGQPQQPEFDPDDFLTAGQALELIQQHVQPLQAFTQEQQLGEAQERARDIASDYATQKGYELDDPLTDLILDHANRYMPEMSAKYGQNGQRAAEAAIAQATESVMGAVTARNKAYYDQQVNQLQGLRNAPREMPVTASAGQQLNDNTGGGKSLTSLVGNYFSQPG